MQIEMTLDQLRSFIPKLTVTGGGVKYRAILKCIPILEQSLLNNVFQKPHSDTVKIESKRELAALIARGTGHKPAPAKRGEPYDQKYLALKRRLGENMPHKFMDYGFWMGTQVIPGYGDSLVMKTQQILHKGFDYLSHHEKRRSVLKRAFLDAWQNLIDTIIAHIAEEAITS